MATLERQNFVQNQVRELKNGWPRAEVVRLEDFLGDRANGHRFWDFIYSANLLTAQPDIAARQIIRASAYRLKPGGRLLLASQILNPRTRACAFCREAGTIYRTELELAELTYGLSIHHFPDQVIFRDTPGNNVYLELYRAPEAGTPFRENSPPRSAIRAGIQ
jgi:hypothetical protein